MGADGNRKSESGKRQGPLKRHLKRETTVDRAAPPSVWLLTRPLFMGISESGCGEMIAIPSDSSSTVERFMGISESGCGEIIAIPSDSSSTVQLVNPMPLSAR